MSVIPNQEYVEINFEKTTLEKNSFYFSIFSLVLSLIIFIRSIKMLKKLKNSKLLTGDSTYAQLLRTYIVGGFNLVFGLGISYLFQFFVFYSIEIPLRTYLTNIFAFQLEL